MRQAERMALIVTFLAASIAATACEVHCGLLDLTHNSTRGSPLPKPASCCPENPLAPTKHSTGSGASVDCTGKALRRSVWFLAGDARTEIPIHTVATEQMHTEAQTIPTVFVELLLPPLRI